MVGKRLSVRFRSIGLQTPIRADPKASIVRFALPHPFKLAALQLL